MAWLCAYRGMWGNKVEYGNLWIVMAQVALDNWDIKKNIFII